jgi:hypothetical protein
MPVSQIEKRDTGGTVVQRAEPAKDGKYRCFFRGTNMDPVLLITLDEVADFLRTHPRSGVRMSPGDGVIRDHIFIDGIPR